MMSDHGCHGKGVGYIRSNSERRVSGMQPQKISNNVLAGKGTRTQRDQITEGATNSKDNIQARDEERANV